MTSIPWLQSFAARCLLLGVLLSSALSTGRAADPNDPAPPTVSLGNDTYKLTRGSKFFYARGTEKLVKRARADAVKFCHGLGREMKEISVEEIKGGLVIGDFSKATITFKALLPGDPQLTTTATAASTSAPATSDLDKLEELHRSGVLADPDFDAAKRRVAERSLDDLHARGILTDAEYEAAKKRLAAPAK